MLSQAEAMENQIKMQNLSDPMEKLLEAHRQRSIAKSENLDIQGQINHQFGHHSFIAANSGIGQISNCAGTYYPTVYSYPLSYSHKLGEYDLHLDSCGNLRVIHQGKIVGEFKPKAK